MKKGNSKNIQTSSKASKRRNNKNGKSNNNNKTYYRPKGSKNLTGNAPAAVSDDLQQYVKFSSGSRNGTLQVSACVPIYQICSNYHNGSSMIKGGLSLGATDTFPYAMLTAVGGYYAGGGSDVDKDYISPVFSLLGSTFVRYKVMQVEFCYEPQSATTIEDRLVFAFANDPEHPKIKNTPAAATQTQLLALQDSVAFAPWRAWTLDVSSIMQNDKEYYIWNQDSTSELDNRFIAFASIGCLASVEPTTTTAQTVYGILYARFKFEYYELCPVVTSVASLTKRNCNELTPVNCGDVNCKRCSRKCIHAKDATRAKSVEKS